MMSRVHTKFPSCLFRKLDPVAVYFLESTLERPDCGSEDLQITLWTASIPSESADRQIFVTTLHQPIRFAS